MNRNEVDTLITLAIFVCVTLSIVLIMFAYLSDRDTRNNSVRIEAVRMGHARFVVVPNTDKVRFEWLATDTAELKK